jgi:serine protease Do
MKRQVILALCLVLVLVLAACGGGGDEPQPTPEAQTEATPEGETEVLEVLEVTYAQGFDEEMAPVDPGNEYEPDETVYLSVQLKGNPRKGVVTSRFFYEDQEITDVSLDLAEMYEEEGLIFVIGGNTFVGFTLTHEQPFPPGDGYRADVSLDGQPVGSYGFTVLGSEEVEAEPTQAPEQASSDVASSIQDVKSATIQIEAAGSFVHPEFGQLQNVAGHGSGFIIDPSGIAVTNNHVVTGAALLRVFVGGDDEPVNAKILGVSECSDLAVIDLEGDGYPYLEWYDGEITTGLPIYAAGFPLGDPEYTLLQGIISKERAGGETNWASVDKVVEHTALTNPGNSGGPVITQDGKVVGVHYAGNADTEQHFAIARDEALPVIEVLQTGQDLDSIGVNGEAVNDGEGLSGIWVASVESGSPADRAGIQGGDIITELEGLVLSTDWTKADYCDVLRTHNPEDALDIQVVRFDTQEVLEGQLNGPPLQQAFSFAQELEGDQEAAVDEGEEGGEAPAGYSEYVKITDDSGALVVAVPVEWSEVDGSPLESDGEVMGATIAAAASLDGLFDTWSQPGVFIAASSILTEQYDQGSLLDLDKDSYSQECTYQGRSDYQDSVYTGLYDHFAECGASGATFINLAAAPEGNPFLILVQVQLVSDADVEALDKVLNSFEVVGTLPGP